MEQACGNSSVWGKSSSTPSIPQSMRFDEGIEFFKIETTPAADQNERQSSFRHECVDHPTGNAEKARSFIRSEKALPDASGLGLSFAR